MYVKFENNEFDDRDIENGENSNTIANESQVRLSSKKDRHLMRRTKCEKILLFLLIVFVLVIIILVTVLTMQRKDLAHQKTADENTTPEPDVCLTPDCAKASSRIYEKLEMSVDPCQDFYRYACGRCKKKHALPDDKLSHGTTTILDDDNLLTNRYLLEDMTSYSDIEAIVKAKRFYASCMDLQKIQEKGTAPAEPLLNKLGGWPVVGSSPGGNWSEKDFSLVKLLVLLYKYGSRSIINLKVTDDLNELDKNILYVGQPEFGLPARTHLLDDNLDHTREAYVTLASSVAQLFGAEKTAADKEMREVLELEIDLAKFDMFEYTKGIFDLENVKIAINESETIVVEDLPYYEKVLDVLRNHGKRTIANYGVWMIGKTIASILDSRFKNLLNTYSEALWGTSTPTPRWKECVATTIKFFPIAVGHMYVKETFDDSTKAEVLEMIANIRNVFKERLNDNDWIDGDTEMLVKDKADAIKERIGYPDEVMDVNKINKLYENVIINRNDYYQNILTKLKKTTTDTLKKLRSPVDKNRWSLSPSDVNAYYSPSFNKIIFPAGILRNPVYDKGQPKSLNYGSIGTIVGHEITHGFDNTGRHFDMYGNLKQWWNLLAILIFEEKARCFVDQYNNFVVPKTGLNVSGILTLNENIADNGGIKQSFTAYRKWVEQHGKEEPILPGLNFTHNQLFFISFAQFHCQNARPEGLIYQIRTEVHTPNHERVIGTLQNSEDFSAAFGCKKNSRMNPEMKCYVW